MGKGSGFRPKGPLEVSITLEVGWWRRDAVGARERLFACVARGFRV
jgi:hypothetical protein